MSIVYGAVACGTRVLCEQTIGNVDFGKSVRLQLENYVQEYTTYPLEGHTYNCYCLNGISYIAVTTAATSQQQTLAFLRKLYTLFTSDRSRLLEAQSGAEYCHQIDFGRILSAEMAAFNNQDKTRITQLQDQVNNVSLMMHQNLTGLNERGTRLDDLYEKTDQFQADAQMFQSTTKRVKQKTFMENCRMTLLLYGAIFVIAFVILMLILWKAGVFDQK
ncbi:hypothetical protein Aperf_G00000017749 [Anoplocephala perfoliata]